MAGRVRTIPGIERDLVLDKLKKLYEAIRFANFDEGDSSASASVAAQQSVAEVAPVSEISIDLDDLLAEPVRDFLPESAAMPEALDAPVGESAAVPEPASSEKPVSVSAVTEPMSEPMPVVAPASVPEPDPAPATVGTAPEPVPVSESVPAVQSVPVSGACGRRCRCLRRPVFRGRTFRWKGGPAKRREPGAMLRLGSVRRGLPDRLPDRWLPPPLKPIPNRSRRVVVSDSLFDLVDLVIRHRGEAPGHHVPLRNGRAAGSRCFERFRVGIGQKPGHAAAPQQRATAGKEQDDAVAPGRHSSIKWMNRRSP